MMDLNGGKYIHPQMTHFPGEFPLAIDPITNTLFVGCCGSTISSYEIKNDTLVTKADANPYRKENGKKLCTGIFIFLLLNIQNTEKEKVSVVEIAKPE